MRYFQLLACFILMVAGTGSSFAEKPVPADSMGLSKGSVFGTPTPKVYHYNATPPGQSKVLPRAYLGAPPQIPHDIADFLPITTDNNMCVACHARPDLWGKERAKGDPTPIPSSHYTDLRNGPGKVTEHLNSARFTCNQCHVPQTDAPALVENSFSSPKKR